MSNQTANNYIPVEKELRSIASVTVCSLNVIQMDQKFNHELTLLLLLWALLRESTPSPEEDLEWPRPRHWAHTCWAPSNLRHQRVRVLKRTSVGRRLSTLRIHHTLPPLLGRAGERQISCLRWVAGRSGFLGRRRTGFPRRWSSKSQHSRPLCPSSHAVVRHQADQRWAGGGGAAETLPSLNELKDSGVQVHCVYQRERGGASVLGWTINKTVSHNLNICHRMLSKLQIFQLLIVGKSRSRSRFIEFGSRCRYSNKPHPSHQATPKPVDCWINTPTTTNVVYNKYNYSGLLKMNWWLIKAHVSLFFSFQLFHLCVQQVRQVSKYWTLQTSSEMFSDKETKKFGTG